MCKGPGLSRNSLPLVMTGEKAKKQERVDWDQGGGQGLCSCRALQTAVRILSFSSEKQGEMEGL